MVESGRVPGKGRIRTNIEKLFGQVPKNGRFSMCTEKLVESVRVPENSRIQASTGKR